jgi:hypothetical protein
VSVIQPQLARFAADLHDAIDKVLESHDKLHETYGPVQVRLYTDDGLTATFFEEGIEFYPKEKTQ